MLHSVIMGAQQCFHGPETGALVPCHMALFCLLFFIVCLWEEKDLLCCWSWEALLHCLLQPSNGWWIWAGAPLHSGEVSRWLPWCGRCCFLPALQRLWDSPLHLLPLLSCSGKPLIANKIGARVWEGFFYFFIFFFSEATRSLFLTSEKLGKWIWI